MSSLIRHNCGLVVAHSLYDAYSMISTLQHRGQEAAGIAAIGDTIDILKWIGPVSTFDLGDLHAMFPSSKYHTYMAHVRYATKGRKEEILDDAHPHTVGGIVDHCGNHVIVRDCDAAIVHNGHVAQSCLASIDDALLQTSCDSEALLHYYLRHGEQALIKNIPGAYTLAIADKRRKGVIVIRDNTGIKPGVLGKKDGKHIVASEDIAIRKNGGSFVEDLSPGVVYDLLPDGDYGCKTILLPSLRQCSFEWNYLANLETILNGELVQKVRRSLGRVVAEQLLRRVSNPDDQLSSFHPSLVDLVTYLPRTPVDAGKEFADTIGLPYEQVLYKMNAIRSFLGSTTVERRALIDENLFMFPGKREQLRGKRAIVVDDSMVRGNNVARTRHLLYDVAKVEEALYVLYTPKIGIIGNDGIPRGCEWGVDMAPDSNDFIARGKTELEISAEVDMPVLYITYDGMLEGFRRAGVDPAALCTYCIGGDRPV